MSHEEAQTQQVGSCIYAVPTGVHSWLMLLVEERKWVKAFAEHAHVPDFPLWKIFHWSGLMPPHSHSQQMQPGTVLIPSRDGLYRLRRDSQMDENIYQFLKAMG